MNDLVLSSLSVEIWGKRIVVYFFYYVHSGGECEGSSIRKCFTRKKLCH